MKRCGIRGLILTTLMGSLLGCPASVDGPTGDALLDVVPAFDDDPGAMVRAHAHNDYYHERPLLDALDQRFYSVEADVLTSSDELSVAHFAWEYFGSLTELYLEPLATLVRARGSVYGDDGPFTLWIDLKSTGDDTIERLDEALAPYKDVLSEFDDDDTVVRPITVVLTGDANLKQRYVEREGAKWACRDSNDYSTSDPEADRRWRYYALPFGSTTGWAGDAPTSEEQAALGALADDVHGKGRALRLYGAPDTPAVWTATYDAGVDFINTDDLGGLADFLSAY